jgi:Tfp pilus assembly protein FimV
VATLHELPGVTETPARLTRRGVLALSTATALSAGVLVWLASLSAPPAPAPARPPARITVQAGDTLWSIATAIAPDRDPRDEVAALQRLNHLHGVSLAVGQVLRTR